MLIDHREGCFGDERLFAREHLVEDHAEAVEVAALVERQAVSLLGAHVMRSAEDRADAGDVALEPQLPRKAKVDEGERAVIAEQQVAGFHVPVQYADVV